MRRKLVRDKIPNIIKNAGKTPVTHIASKKEYWKELRLKLKEEVDEFLKDENEEEISDILEVIYAICDFKKISKTRLESLRKKKSLKRGKFKKKTILDKVT